MWVFLLVLLLEWLIHHCNPLSACPYLHDYVIILECSLFSEKQTEYQRDAGCKQTDPEPSWHKQDDRRQHSPLLLFPKPLDLPRVSHKTTNSQGLGRGKLLRGSSL